MRKILFLLFSFFCLTIVNAQKGKAKKPPRATNRDVAATSLNIDNDSDVDTLRLKEGKAYVLLIDVRENMKNVAVAGDDLERNELIKNFGKNKFEIINLYAYTYVLFGNGQYLNLTGEGNTYQAVAYWSGKMEDDPVVRDGKDKATEYIGEQLGTPKESSYITNARNFKTEVSDLQGKNNFTKASKEVQDAYLQLYSVPEICYINNYHLFNTSQSGVKSITTYLQNGTGKKEKRQTVLLNNDGYPISIEQGEDSKKFEYQNQILKKITSNNYTPTIINYDNNKLITTKDVGAGIDTKVYWLENGQLLSKSYLLMKDAGSESMTTQGEEKWEKGCLNNYINGDLWTTNCYKKTAAKDFNSTYTSYQDGNVLQKTSYQVTEKDSKLYEVIITDEGDKSQLKQSYKLNDKNLVESVIFTKNKSQRSIIMEYTY